MANHKSAAKRARQTIRKRTQNLRSMSSVRTFEKKLRAAINSKKGEEAQALLKTFTKKIDKAAQKGVIHANQASRKVSRLAKKVQNLSK